MVSILLAATLSTQATDAKPQPFEVQYAQAVAGRNVTVCLDGQHVKMSFAGRLGFRDQNHSWTSFCANVRAPIHGGQYFSVRSQSSKKFGGNVAKAGNIVAKFFKSAQSADQCAGLQLAIWEAIEDGGDKPNFLGGKFQAQADRNVLAYAEAYYDAIDEDGDAIFLENDSPKGGQDQITV